MKQTDTDSLDTRRLDLAEKRHAIITCSQKTGLITRYGFWCVEVNGREYTGQTLRQALDNAFGIRK